jgi:hypothetical protein
VLKSYLAIAVRQLLARKLYTAINVAGLALGLASALLIALFVRHELSYDRQYADSGCIVRISEDIHIDPPQHFAGSSPAIAPLLGEFFPGIEKAAQLLSCFDVGGGTLVASRVPVLPIMSAWIEPDEQRRVGESLIRAIDNTHDMNVVPVLATALASPHFELFQHRSEHVAVKRAVLRKIAASAERSDLAARGTAVGTFHTGAGR